MTYRPTFKRLGVLLFILLISLSTIAQAQQVTSTPTPQLHEIAQLGRGTAITVAWSPDGTTLAVGGSLGVWMYSDQLVTLGFQAIEDSVQEVKWVSTHSDLLAVHTTIKQADNSFVSPWRFLEWSSEQMTFTPVLTEFDQVGRIEWSADGHYLALQNQDGLHIVELDTYTTVSKFTDGILVGFGWNPNSQQFARVLSDRVEMYDAAAQQYQYRIVDVERPDYPLKGFEWSPDGEKIAVVSGEGYRLPAMIQLYTTADGHWINRLMSKVVVADGLSEGNPGQDYFFYNIIRFQWGPKSDRLVVFEEMPSYPISAVVVIWNYEYGDEIIERKLFPLSLGQVQWSPNNEYFLFAAHTRGSNSPVGHGYAYQPQSDLSTSNPFQDTRWSFSPDKQKLASYIPSATVVNLYITNSLEYNLLLKGDTDRIQAISWHPDNKRLAVVTGDELTIWDTDTGHILANDAKFLGEGSQIIAWDESGQFLALSSWMMPLGLHSDFSISVHIWDMRRQDFVSVLRGHHVYQYFGAHWDTEQPFTFVTYDYQVTTTWDISGRRLRIDPPVEPEDRTIPPQNWVTIDGIGTGLWNPTMTQFASKDDKGVIHLWEVVK